jgi:hypothetical protein
VENYNSPLWYSAAAAKTGFSSTNPAKGRLSAALPTTTYTGPMTFDFFATRIRSRLPSSSPPARARSLVTRAGTRALPVPPPECKWEPPCPRFSNGPFVIHKTPYRFFHISCLKPKVDRTHLCEAARTVPSHGSSHRHGAFAFHSRFLFYTRPICSTAFAPTKMGTYAWILKRYT